MRKIRAIGAVSVDFSFVFFFFLFLLMISQIFFPWTLFCKFTSLFLQSFHLQGEVQLKKPSRSDFRFSLSNFRFVDSFNFSKARPDSPSPSLVRLPLFVRASCRRPRHNHHSRNPIVCLLSHTPSSGLTLFPPRFHCVRSLSSLNNPRGNSRPKHSRRGAPCSQHVVC